MDSVWSHLIQIHKKDCLNRETLQAKQTISNCAFRPLTLTTKLMLSTRVARAKLPAAWTLTQRKSTHSWPQVRSLSLSVCNLYVYQAPSCASQRPLWPLSKVKTTTMYSSMQVKTRPICSTTKEQLQDSSHLSLRHSWIHLTIVCTLCSLQTAPSQIGQIVARQPLSQQLMGHLAPNYLLVATLIVFPYLIVPASLEKWPCLWVCAIMKQRVKTKNSKRKWPLLLNLQ